MNWGCITAPGAWSSQGQEHWGAHTGGRAPSTPLLPSTSCSHRLLPSPSRLQRLVRIWWLAELLCLTHVSVFPGSLGLVLPEANVELQANWEAELSSLLHVPSAGAFTEVTHPILAGTLVHGISRGLVWSEGPQISRAALGERVLLSPSRDTARAALWCPSSTSSPPAHQQALSLCRASSPCL